MPHHPGRFFTAVQPEGAFLLLIGLLTVGAVLGLLVQTAAVIRDWRLLERVRCLFATDRLCHVLPAEFESQWAAAGGSSIGTGAVTLRIQQLAAMRDRGAGAAESLREQAREQAERRAPIAPALAVILVGLGFAGSAFSLAAPLRLTGTAGTLRSTASTLPPISPAALGAAAVCAAVGLLAGAVVALMGLTGTLFLGAFQARLESFSLTVLEPRVMPTDPLTAVAQFAAVMETSSRRFEGAIVPFAARLDEFSGRLHESAEVFTHRLDHASQNVLQAVEGMREAAAALIQGAAGLDRYYAQLETIYARLEPLAAQVAGSQAGQQERLSEIAAGLHGITQSLTTVVAGVNDSQAAAGRVAEGVSEALAAMQATAARVDASVDRLVGELTRFASALPPATSPAGPREEVTLRRVVEQQQQFLHLLDDRLTALDRAATRPAALRAVEGTTCYSSSSSSSSSSRSSSSISSASAPKAPPARALSNHSM